MTRRECYLFILLGLVILCAEVIAKYSDGIVTFSLAGPSCLLLGMHCLEINATIKRQNEMWFRVLGVNGPN